MENFLEDLTLDFFSKGKDKLSKNVDIIDVRYKEENSLLKFRFAKNIPLHGLTKRMNEIPEDKTAAMFCSAGTRVTIAYSFLPALGFENGKMFDTSIGELADTLKPGFVAKLYE